MDLITKENQEVLKDYYSSMHPDQSLSLKFRYIKILALDTRISKTKWLLLDRTFNKRRISNSKLPEYLTLLFDKNLIPLRVFQSVCEWLNPHEVFKIGKNTRLTNSGILPLECDTSLKASIAAAKELTQFVDNYFIVYSGNKSIHIWWLHDYFVRQSEYVDNYIYSHPYMRERLERVVRKKLFANIQSITKYPLDRRNAIDTRRVVPIIGTINALTGRVVTKLSSPMILNLKALELEQKSTLKDWSRDQ